MNNEHRPEVDEAFHPRVIIWQLTSGGHQAAPGMEGSTGNGHEPLSQHECLLIIDSIARLSKPIVVLTGPHLLARTDLVDIVGYANALGLKMIVELLPEELTDDTLKKFRPFGPRIFRIVLDGRIVEDMDHRYRRTPEFCVLEDAVGRMKKAGYEIHFSLNVADTDVRKLSFNVDYAFRSIAKGLYCHLKFDHPEEATPGAAEEEAPESVDDFITKLSEMKPLIPNNMYFSPQCVKYAPYLPDEQLDLDFEQTDHPKWIHWCLAGKSFAYLDDVGKITVCGGLGAECGDLRANGYDFAAAWSGSDVFRDLRHHLWTCRQTRLQLGEPLEEAHAAKRNNGGSHR